MECYYHPERESTDTCAICGKSVCKECGLEIAGKVYCKDCLEKIVGLGLNNAPAQDAEPTPETPIKSEPARLNKQPADESIYQPQSEPVEPITPQHDITYQEEPIVENKAISDDSPYNIKDSINYTGGLESSYIHEPAQEQNYAKQSQIAQNESYLEKEVPQQKVAPQDEFIYPDHSYEPQPRANPNLEDKYEKYLDDLYFDENEIPLNEQLAKDEEQYGSLTKKPYTPKKSKKEEKLLKEKLPSRRKQPMTKEEEIEARIRAEIAKEMGLEDEKPIHNLNYQQDNESMGIVDILLTIVLIIVILIVVYYLIYLFLLSATYPTFMDAVFALTNPQNVINNLLSSQ